MKTYDKNAYRDRNPQEVDDDSDYDYDDESDAGREVEADLPEWRKGVMGLQKRLREQRRGRVSTGGGGGGGAYDEDEREEGDDDEFVDDD